MCQKLLFLIPDVGLKKVLDSLAFVVQEDGGAQAAKVVVGVQRSDAGHLNTSVYHCFHLCLFTNDVDVDFDLVVAMGA